MTASFMVKPIIAPVIFFVADTAGPCLEATAVLESLVPVISVRSIDAPIFARAKRTPKHILLRGVGRGRYHGYRCCAMTVITT